VRDDFKSARPGHCRALTRQSISLEKSLAKQMDARVKPAHDESTKSHHALRTNFPIQADGLVGAM
jgi:hypothetical protein